MVRFWQRRDPLDGVRVLGDVLPLHVHALRLLPTSAVAADPPLNFLPLPW